MMAKMLQNHNRITSRARTMALTASLTFIIHSAILPDHAQAASFQCDATHLTRNEKTICHNRTLNDQDVRMATMYKMLKGLAAMGMSGEMADNQHAWLKKREACRSNMSCISKAYKIRIRQLQKIYDMIDKPIL